MSVETLIPWHAAIIHCYDGLNELMVVKQSGVWQQVPAKVGIVPSVAGVTQGIPDNRPSPMVDLPTPGEPLK